MLHRCLFRQAHCLVDTAGEIHHLWPLGFLLCLRFLRYTLYDKLRKVGLLRLAFLLWHRGSPQRKSHLVHRTAHMRHQRRSECDMCQMSHIEYYSQARLYASHVIGTKLSHLIAQLRLVHIQLTNQMCQFARINLHRTGCRTETIRSTCLVAIVLILFAQCLCPLRISSCCLKLAYLSLNSDTHSG